MARAFRTINLYIYIYIVENKISSEINASVKKTNSSKDFKSYYDIRVNDYTVGALDDIMSDGIVLKSEAAERTGRKNNNDGETRKTKKKKKCFTDNDAP